MSAKSQQSTTGLDCSDLDCSFSSPSLFPLKSKSQIRPRLFHYTCIGYLGGAVVCAGKGLIEGVKASEPRDTTNLRVNRILNVSGHANRKFGNRVGLESGMVEVRDTNDVMNNVVAGLGTDALFKAAFGPRSAAVAGAIGAGKQVLKIYVPI